MKDIDNPLISSVIAQEDAIRRLNNTTVEFRTADWFINYNKIDNTTAIVVEGADAIGVMFIVLENNHVDDLKKIVDSYKDFNKGINGSLGECIRWACMQDDIIPERCTIGGWRSRLTISRVNNK